MKAPKILLIHSGGTDRYWAYITEIQRKKPADSEYPPYYGINADRMNMWFRVIGFEKAPRDVMKLCVVKSSGSVLSEASKHSMSPYFIIEYEDKEDEYERK